MRTNEKGWLRASATGPQINDDNVLRVGPINHHQILTEAPIISPAPVERETRTNREKSNALPSRLLRRSISILLSLWVDNLHVSLWQFAKLCSCLASRHYAVHENRKCIVESFPNTTQARISRLPDVSHRTSSRLYALYFVSKSHDLIPSNSEPNGGFHLQAHDYESE